MSKIWISKKFLDHWNNFFFKEGQKHFGNKIPFLHTGKVFLKFAYVKKVFATTKNAPKIVENPPIYLAIHDWCRLQCCSRMKMQLFQPRHKPWHSWNIYIYLYIFLFLHFKKVMSKFLWGHNIIFEKIWYLHQKYSRRR